MVDLITAFFWIIFNRSVLKSLPTYCTHVVCIVSWIWVSIDLCKYQMTSFVWADFTHQFHMTWNIMMVIVILLAVFVASLIDWFFLFALVFYRRARRPTRPVSACQWRVKWICCVEVHHVKASVEWIASTHKIATSEEHWTKWEASSKKEMTDT